MSKGIEWAKGIVTKKQKQSHLREWVPPKQSIRQEAQGIFMKQRL
jgi:hypothetical protein